MVQQKEVMAQQENEPTVKAQLESNIKIQDLAKDGTKRSRMSPTKAKEVTTSSRRVITHFQEHQEPKMSIPSNKNPRCQVNAQRTQNLI